MISKQDRIKPRTVEDLERKYNFAERFAQQQQQQGKGEDGLTPYIGANGHWWIGTTDTGVDARGTTVSFTPTATEGMKIGTITINGVAMDMYAPDHNHDYATKAELQELIGVDEDGEPFVKVGETILTETLLQDLLALLA